MYPITAKRGFFGGNLFFIGWNGIISREGWICVKVYTYMG